MHVAVLQEQVLAVLAPAAGETVVDLTAGRGGHAALMAEMIGPAGTLVLFDLDADNLHAATERVTPLCENVVAIHDNFGRVQIALAERAISADVVLADLGFSSTQMDAAERGFSFRHDGPLDMRYHRPRAKIGGAGDVLAGAGAAELVAMLPEDELADIIQRYGEEPLARKIARNLVLSRRRAPIETTAQLARIVVESYGGRAAASRTHPATRTFMALRIAVNDELETLSMLLEAVDRGAEHACLRGDGGWLARGARVGIIAFHSLEDRLVKRHFAQLSTRGFARRLTKRPVVAGPAEIAANPRARSAKLRVVAVDGR